MEIFSLRKRKYRYLGRKGELSLHIKVNDLLGINPTQSDPKRRFKS
jgi:hypothetical protein